MTYQRPLTVEEMCRKLKPVFGKKIDNLYLRYSLAETREEKDELMHFVNALYQKNLSVLLSKNVLLEPPTEKEVAGEYPLAMVSYANKQLYPFALREHDWPRHVCISGMSGSGKTTLAFHILENFIRKDKPFLVFDWKKSFRPLMAIDDSLVTFTIGDDSIANRFKMNILRPPEGIAPKEWITILSDLLAESFSVSFGVHKVLIETIDELFEGWNVYGNNKNTNIEPGKYYPTWQHVKKMLEDKSKKSRGREATWVESAMRIATLLTFGAFGKVVNYDGEKSISVEDILDKRVILEMNSLGNVEKKFFCEFVLTYIYKLKKSKQTRISNSFDHAILVDEAHNIFLKDKTTFVKESVTDMIYREMREYGTSLICLDQHISKLSDTVNGNSACHIAFQQQLPQDSLDVSRIMYLFDNKEIFSQLPVGSAVVKLSERYTSPFLIQVPFAKSRNIEVTNEDIIKRLKSFVLQLQVERKDDEEFNENLIKPEQVPVEIKVGGGGLVKEVKVVRDSQDDLIQRSIMGQMNALNDSVVEDVKVQETEEDIFSQLKELVELAEAPEEEISKQDVLRNFINERLGLGEDFDTIREKLIFYSDEENLVEIQIAINGFVEDKSYNEYRNLLPLESFKKSEIPQNNSAEININNRNFGYENTDQKEFLDYLRQNPNHKDATVELYGKIGFSVRRGNKIKNELLDRNLITIREEKNQKGWKKIIRLV
ncbi:MAG: hypothetical protein UT26_C0032G0002 [Microgenomates group bacterium GW2011_GWC1_39_12]|nr:MAG: hypothetical protein UT26_C0032G0002 [Microgenomates group bacterium GW2011_GWC1_39_12]